jgi:hypothetical protein
VLTACGSSRAQTPAALGDYGFEAKLNSRRVCRRGVCSAANGQTGVRGPTGPAGPTGPSGVASTQLITRTATTSLAPTPATQITSTATCPAGTTLLTGGYALTSSIVSLLASPIESRATSTSTWRANNYATGIAGSSLTIQASALCTT